jgi:hypothetical protein
MTLIGRAALAAVITFGVARADAQITTVIESPKRTDAKQQVAAQREQVAQDSIARVTLTGMKQWVDSAAGALAIRPDTGTAPSETPVAPPQSTPPRADSVIVAKPKPAAAPAEFRDGARAPNTATPLPTVALAGAVMILLGALLRRRTIPATPRRPRQ